jgi:ubiquinone/menaquinone biosynthesis C-methylase UbiE
LAYCHYARIEKESIVSKDYEDYHAVSQIYDKYRQPLGLDFLTKIIKQHKKPSEELSLLDVGCGTGQYIKIFSSYVGTCHGMDPNQSMLDMAIKKSPASIFKQGSAMKLPYESNSMDVIFSSQVLHHLQDKQSTRDYSNCNHAISEMHRVLRDEGIIIINYSTDKQLDAFWWHSLIPQASMTMKERNIPLCDLKTWLGMDNNKHVFEHPIIHELLMGEDYFDPEGPLKESWRNSDSRWSLSTTTELDRAMKQVKSLSSQGKMEQFIHENDRLRKEIGQTTFIVAKNDSKKSSEA